MSLPTAFVVNVNAPFPSQVLGNGAIIIQKSNGIYTVSLDYRNIGSITNPTSKLILVQDPTSGTFSTARPEDFVVSYSSLKPPQPAVVQVATRSFVPRIFDAVNKQMMVRSRHRAADFITSLQIAIPNWCVDFLVSNQEHGTGAAASVTAAIEYPEGVFTQIKFSGATTGIIPDLTTLLSDATVVEIPNGAFFFVRIFFSNAAAIVYDTSGGDDGHGEAVTYAPAGVPDQTMGGTVVQTSAGFHACPCAIVAKSAKPAIYMLGASGAYGSGDLYIDDSGDRGAIARSIGPSLGYLMGSVRGDLVNFFVSGGNANRIALAAYTTHVICDLGLNDINGGRTAAQVMADLQTAYALFASKPIVQLTTSPQSTSTDGWTTAANQTVAATNAQRIALNVLLRAKPAPLVDVYDVTDIVETARDSGIWKPGYTIDGIHNSALASAAVRDARAIDPAAFTGLPAAARPPLLAVPQRYDNVVVNGGMLVSQELGTTGSALVSTVVKYILDSWEAQYTHAAGTAVVTSAQMAAGTFPVARPGFSFGHQIKATTAISAPANGDLAKYRSKIEGYRIAHWGFGAAGASYIRYAFWLYSTVAGTPFIKFSNDVQTRCYYVEVPIAAGWNFISGTVPGDTAGAWQATTSAGLVFELFVSGKAAAPAAPNAWSATNTSQTTNSNNLLGTNNNQTILTGLWIASGTQLPAAADLPNLMRSFLDEQWECFRYYWKTFAYSQVPAQNVGTNTGEYQFAATLAGAVSQRNAQEPYHRPMRVTPSVFTTYNPAAANAQVRDITAGADCSATNIGGAAGNWAWRVGQTNNAATVIGNLMGVHMTADARL